MSRPISDSILVWNQLQSNEKIRNNSSNMRGHFDKPEIWDYMCKDETGWAEYLKIRTCFAPLTEPMLQFILKKIRVQIDLI